MFSPAWLGYADDTWVYAVQIHAQVSEAPPRIELIWRPDIWGADRYSVYRKPKEGSNWGNPVAVLSGLATNWMDTNVVEGVGYEYQIVKNATLGYTGYGYIFSGIRVPLIENRGKCLLLVETNSTAGLDFEIARLRNDLVGDGWSVAQRGVSSNQTPSEVRAIILEEYAAAFPSLNTVFLLGHVPVLQSGNLDWDTHGKRPVPADAYYGDLNDDWPTDPTNSPSYMPSDIKLMIGRADFANMPGAGSRVPWRSESELLRNYLQKDHQWRHGLLPVPRRALMGNARGDEGGGAAASSGYRNFDPLVGPDVTTEAGVKFTTPPDERWITKLSREPYLWAYGCGGGFPNGCGGLGTNVVSGVPGFLFSTDVYEVDAKAVFVMLFGSWFGQWDLKDNLLRSFLAAPTYGLACCMAGRPHWFLHHLAMGETIGYGTRISMNNVDFYGTQSNAMARAVYVALMGDPTLRMEPVIPPSNLSASAEPASVGLAWAPSTDAVIGYHIYRAADVSGPFTRLTDVLVEGASFSDLRVPPGSYVYMVRAVKLQQNPSGSYFNPSQGIFVSAQVQGSPPPPLYVQARSASNGVTLTWNSIPGTVYRVLAANSETGGKWSDISGPLTASGASLSWADSDQYASPERYYRVVAP